MTSLADSAKNPSAEHLGVEDMPRVAVAISGGGHRAALFGLGALLYLADCGKSREVESIASVSGGSLANGYVAQSADFRTVDRCRFPDGPNAVHSTARAQGDGLASRWVDARVPRASDRRARRARRHLVHAVGGGLSDLGLRRWPRLARRVASWRSSVVSRAFARTLYSPKGSPTALSGITHEPRSRLLRHGPACG